MRTPTKRELILHFKAIQNLKLTQVWCVIEKCCLITQYICLSNAKKLKIDIMRKVWPLLFPIYSSLLKDFRFCVILDISIVFYTSFPK